MKRIVLTVTLLSVVFVGLAADPSSPTPAKEAPKLAATTTRMKCAICQGKGSLKVSPPDVGQFAGRINDRSYWDVKLDPCPICGRGHGRREVWNLTKPEPSAEPPCMTCGWSGLVQCRKCLASGIVKCPWSGCKDGWILTQQQQQSSCRRRSSRTSLSVKPCPECKGVGKIVCPECNGMRADLCKRCFGTGRKR